MLYNPPVNATDPNQAYVDANAQVGIQGSSPPAHSIEYPQREIVNAVTLSGLTPTNNDLTQLWQAMQRVSSLYAVDQGSVNNVVISPTLTPISYVAGLAYLVKIAVTNTGAATINVANLGARSITRISGAALQAGDLVSGGICLMTYDGLRFQAETLAATSISEQSLWHYGVDTGTVNHLVSTVTPGIANYDLGLTALVFAANTNTGATNVNLNGLGVKNIVSTQGSALTSGMITSGCFALIAFDGTNFELLSIFGTVTGGGGGGFAPYFVSVKSATITSPPGSPATGDTYLIPPGATGSWSGLSNQVTQWSGTAWVTLNVPIETMVGVADQDDFWKRIVGGTWRSIFATVAEAAAGASSTLAVTPLDLRRYATILGPLRVPWVAVNSITVATPPGSPTLGDIYVIPPGATGAWSGLTNYMAQWDGGTWRTLLPPARTVIGCIDTNDTQFYTGTGWRSFWATPAEALLGQSTVLGITPADLAYVLAHQASGDELITDLFFYGCF